MGKGKPVTIHVSKEEREQLRLAAKLSCVSLNQFIRKALNDRMRKMGVDSVLLKEIGNE